MAIATVNLRIAAWLSCLNAIGMFDGIYLLVAGVEAAGGRKAKRPGLLRAE